MTLEDYLLEGDAPEIRGRNGWAPPDTWSLDGYLLSWLPDAIAHLRVNSHGYPVGLGYPEGMDLNAVPFGDHGDIDLGVQRWNEILTKIETGLRAGRRIGEMDYGDKEEMKAVLAEFNEAWALMGEWFFHLWD